MIIKPFSLIDKVIILLTILIHTPTVRSSHEVKIMTLRKLNIGNLSPSLPIIQGGMGVGVSLHQLAGTVAKCGGIGIISGAQIGYREPDFLKNTLGANLRALETEIVAAKKIAPTGIIGLNLMVAMKHYGEMAKKAVEAGIDLIISGAGLPLDLPLFVKGSATKIAPIVSSGKAASVICRMWDRRHQVAPDCIVIEGPLAGGHLGFSIEDIEKNPDVLDIMEDVKKVATEYEIKYNKSIPIVVAGGFYTAEDVAHALERGADGVQMGTRFVTTYECDASDAYKQTYINAKASDIGIIKSPVGMPGRAILNDFIQNPGGNKACYYDCIQKCTVTDIPYCISQSLINAAKGKLDHALLFCGSNAYKATKMEHVEDIFNEFRSLLS